MMHLIAAPASPKLPMGYCLNEHVNRAEQVFQKITSWPLEKAHSYKEGLYAVAKQLGPSAQNISTEMASGP
jgi:hypothetical protein